MFQSNALVINRCRINLVNKLGLKYLISMDRLYHRTTNKPVWSRSERYSNLSCACGKDKSLYNVMALRIK